MPQREIHAVVDLQFGSTGKGSLAARLALDVQPDTICTAWHPNAGHTSIVGDRKFVHIQLANGIVSPKLRRILIGPGSVIDADILAHEYDQCRDLLQMVKIAIHPHAAVVSQEHRDAEKVFNRIGSTQKGCAEAVIQKMRRDPQNMNIAKVSSHPFVQQHVVTAEKYQSLLDESEVMLVEGAQGYALSIYHGMYPYTTSRDVSTHQLFADCGIPYRFGVVRVYGCIRTYPIRVANRFDSEGNQVGYSGNCYPDQREISWPDLDIEPELTTVTKLPRRIFTFSELQYEEAVRMCGVDYVFVNFLNYLPTQAAAYAFCKALGMMSPAQVKYVGIGPNVEDVRKIDITSFPQHKALDGFTTALGPKALITDPLMHV